MAKALLAAALVVSAVAVAQPPPSTIPPAPGPSAPPPSTLPADAASEDFRRELEQKLEAQKQELKELREELRAQGATRAATEGWQEEWVEEKRKLELFEPNGYLRLRPDLFNKFDLGRSPDPAGYRLFPASPTSSDERTVAGVNMRFRFEPTLNISEEVRIKTQVDMLDNVVLGSNPDYAFSRSANSAYAYDRDEFTLMSNSQVSPRSAINAVQDSIAVKRVYGEVSTPIGILRLGRMGSHWGLGMLHNDGNGLDNDFGDTVDRAMFVSEPIAGYYLTPMVDFNAEGPLSAPQTNGGQPFDLSNTDDSHSFILAAARRDTEQQAKAKLENNLSVFNYGVHFTYRVQRNDPTDFYNAPYANEGANTANLSGGYVPRNGVLYIPDVWLKFERKAFRLELEAASVLGTLQNRARSGADAANPEDPNAEPRNQALALIQFGGTAQGEYRFMDGALNLQFEVGFASGDKSPGFGNYPRRAVTRNTEGRIAAGHFDGPQYDCSFTCADSVIRNFRFNRDYRVDMILWREILGGVTDAVYAKPTINYRIAEGLNVFGSAIYSRAIYAESTPSSTDANLGIEINAGARYETEDGFFAQIKWGILIPLGGFADSAAASTGATLDTANAFRGSVGIKF